MKRFFSILAEFLMLLISAVFIYLEELIKLIIPRWGKSVENDIILITGSGNGLGKELCKELLKHKAKLVLWDVSSEDNEKVAEELLALGAQSVYHDTVDVSDREQVVQAAKRVRENVGHVTILVNNAGICHMQQFLELTEEAVTSTFHTNILAHFWTIQEFLPNMLKEGKGHIVTICSTFGQMALRGPAPYYASKHAVHGFVECLKDELAHFPNNPKIKFTTAYPFFMKTRMVLGNKVGLHLKFKFPSITPFMEASEVAKRVVNGIRLEKEYLYIPETFRIYLLGNYLLPSKLHRMAIDFFVEESGYSVKLGTNEVSTDVNHNKQDSNPKLFSNFYESSIPTWLSTNIKEKEK